MTNSAEPENSFPSILDARDALNEMIDKGLGELPVQVLVVPDSTLQAIARNAGYVSEKPVLMIDLLQREGRIAFALISTDRFGRGDVPSSTVQ